MRQQQGESTEESVLLPGIESLPQAAAEEVVSPLQQDVTADVVTPPEAIEQLGEAMRREALGRILRTVLLPVAPITALLVPRLLLGDEAFVRLCTNPAFLIPLVLGVGVAVPCATLRTFRKARTTAAHLAEIEDLRVVGPLIDALLFGEDARVCVPAFHTLVRLLPRMRAGDAHLLTETHRAYLRQIFVIRPSVCTFVARSRTGFTLRRPEEFANVHAELQVAILQAFEQVGDAKAVAIVRRLAEREAKTDAQRRVKEAAEACLPLLLARTDQTRAQQTLLRAASGSQEDSAELLRGAAGPIEANPHTLLRSSAPEEVETLEEAKAPDTATNGGATPQLAIA
jgi:hypothetical protein